MMLDEMISYHDISIDSQQKLDKFSEVTNLNNNKIPQTQILTIFWDNILL